MKLTLLIHSLTSLINEVQNRNIKNRAMKNQAREERRNKGREGERKELGIITKNERIQ